MGRRAAQSEVRAPTALAATSGPPPRRDAGQIARQRNDDAPERNAETVDLAEDRKASEHCEADGEQEWRAEQDFGIRVAEKAVDLSLIHISEPTRLLSIS